MTSFDRLGALGVAGLSVAVASCHAVSPSEASAGAVSAVFPVVSDGFVRVFSVSERVFAVTEVTSDGLGLQVSVPLDRLRRVVRLASATAVRVTVEIDADVSRAVSSQSEGGVVETLQRPAGYDLEAVLPADREVLDAFHSALVGLL